ncbi:MAG: helix-turn-helix domain-containing protein [Bacteroidetes bacterium]|nr:helix-turn-helix domain-containing protein [Bacteroidota bacterium]
MSENGTIISIGPQSFKAMLRDTMKETLSHHDEERLKGISPDHLFTRREVAEMFGLEYSSIRRMIERGALKTTADCRYIPKWSIDEYLNKRNCLGSAGEQPRPVPEAKVSLQTESCRPGAEEPGVKAGSSLLSGPDLHLQKTRARVIEKNSKSTDKQ